jgi:hypothetical protein
VSTIFLSTFVDHPLKIISERSAISYLLRQAAWSIHQEMNNKEKEEKKGVWKICFATME